MRTKKITKQFFHFAIEFDSPGAFEWEPQTGVLRPAARPLSALSAFAFVFPRRAPRPNTFLFLPILSNGRSGDRLKIRLYLRRTEEIPVAAPNAFRARSGPSKGAPTVKHTAQTKMESKEKRPISPTAVDLFSFSLGINAQPNAFLYICHDFPLPAIASTEKAPCERLRSIFRRIDYSE